MQGHAVDVHAVAHPQTYDDCDMEFSVWIVCKDMWPMFMKMRNPCRKIEPKLNINLVIVGLEKKKLKKLKQSRQD